MPVATEIRPSVESPKRQAVLDAAADLFMAQGYGAVSMDAVARAAGVSKATLYAYFASKDQLFATIVGEGCRQNMAVSTLLPEAEGDLAAQLHTLGDSILRFLLAPKALAIHRVVIGESVRFPELGRAFYDSGPLAFRTAFGAWLAAQTAAGRLAVADPEMAADQFIGLLRIGVFTRASLGLDPPPDDAEIASTVAAAVSTFLKAYVPGRRGAAATPPALGEDDVSGG